MNQSLKIKISTGKFKGKTIELPSKENTRSSKSIVRESVINSLQTELVGNIFVEVFAGSASVGIEAISRGVDYAFFCEKDKNAYNCLVRNIKSLNIDNARTYFQDSFAFFGELKAAVEMLGKPAVFYFDPPFDIRDGMTDVYEKTYQKISQLSKENVFCIILEARTGIDAKDKIGNFALDKTKKFGNTTLYYYR